MNYCQFENPYRPKELVERRKEISDAKNDTERLTFENSNGDTRAAAYKKSREVVEELELQKLAKSDEEAMLAELELMQKMYIDE